MTARRVSFAPSGLSPATEARVAARRAYGRAQGSGGLAPVVIDRLWADTLTAVDGQPAATAAEMLRRTEHLFVLLEDRAHWPR